MIFADYQQRGSSSRSALAVADYRSATFATPSGVIEKRRAGLSARMSQRKSSSVAMRLSGLAAVFDSEADLGDFLEVIRPGAFAGSLQRNDDVRALWNHDTSQPLGRVSNGTLRLSETGEGLSFELDLPDTTIGRDTWALAQRGDVSGMSFGFRVVRQRWTSGPGGRDLRELLEIDLIEISPVTFPAYSATRLKGGS